MDYNQIIDENIARFHSLQDEYPMLHVAAVPLARPSAPILGRDMSDLRLGLRNPEKANVILLGDPGSGKTAYIQGFTYDPDSTQYLVLSVDVERFVKDSTGDKDTEMANGLMDFINETTRYSVEQNIIVILFIDEFHRIAMVSPSAVEALKPILEKSAHNGFRIVAATTFEEYDEWIAPNRALDQRLLRITLSELPREAVINILKSRAKQYGAFNLADETVFDDIYDTSKRILISNSQPRASIDILLNIIGNITKTEFMRDGKLVREYSTAEELQLNSKYPLSRPMLNRVIQRSYGIDIDNQVSIPKVKEALRTRILNQEQAVGIVISRLELSLTGFNDPTRPKISFLSTGTTGTGKTELAKVISEVLDIPLKRFDMSRYPRPEDAVEFANQLAQAAWSAPNGYILIDEVEKSSREAMNILLQVLDDARLTAANNPNRVISFTGNIINLTTNLASEVYQHSKRFGKADDEVDIELVYQALSESDVFETAVLGRVDAIVPFRPLPDEAMSKIAQNELQFNLDIVETPSRPIFVSKDIIPYIVKDRTSKDTERGGARDAKRNIKNVVIQKLATYLSDEPEEAPLILRLSGVARFRDKTVANTTSADVEVVECYSKQKISNLLSQLSGKIGKPLRDEGLFIPNDENPQQVLQDLIALVKQGYTGFQTIEIDTYNQTEFIIDGVK